MLVNKKPFSFSKHLETQINIIEKSYTDRLRHYLVHLTDSLKTVQIEFFESLSKTTYCNPYFASIIEKNGIDRVDWLKESLEKSNNECLFSLDKIRHNLFLHIKNAAEVVEECDHYTQILSHFSQAEQWKDQIDQYKFQVSMLYCSYQIHHQLLVDIDTLSLHFKEAIATDSACQSLLTNLKQLQTVLTKTLVTTLNDVNHRHPESLLQFLLLLSKQLLAITLNEDYQSKFQADHNAIYIDWYAQLKSSLISWKEIVNNFQEALLAQNYKQVLKEYAINFSKLELLHGQPREKTEIASETALNKMQNKFQDVSIKDELLKSNISNCFYSCDNKGASSKSTLSTTFPK